MCPDPEPEDAGYCKCDWIPTDNCQNWDQCAMDCRNKNPWGPCCRAWNLLEVKTESQTSLQEKSEQKSQPPPVDACGYECKSWIHDDDCKAQDDAAKTCRFHNGPPNSM